MQYTDRLIDSCWCWPWFICSEISNANQDKKQFLLLWPVCAVCQMWHQLKDGDCKTYSSSRLSWEIIGVSKETWVSGTVDTQLWCYLRSHLLKTMLLVLWASCFFCLMSRTISIRICYKLSCFYFKRDYFVLIIIVKPRPQTPKPQSREPKT